MYDPSRTAQNDKANTGNGSHRPSNQPANRFYVPPPRPQHALTTPNHNQNTISNFPSYSPAAPPQFSSSFNVGNGLPPHSSTYSNNGNNFQPGFNYSAQPPSNISSHSPNLYAPTSHRTSPPIPQPPIPTTFANNAHLTQAGTRHPSQPQPQPSNSAFYDLNAPGYNHSNYSYPNSHPQQPSQQMHTTSSSHMHPSMHQQAQPQIPTQPQYVSQPPQSSSQPPSSAVPYMVAGLQQMSNMANSNGLHHAALGAQLLETFVPSAAGYTNQIIDQGQQTVKSFMRMPKYYFAVNHRYVLKKLSLILMPFMNRTWGRQRGLDQGNFDGISTDGSTVYLPPREDVNAPDLYIPVMAFLTYVLVVGIVFGMRNAFQADVLAKYFSKGLAVLTMEVLIIKLGLYLINARQTPWLDVIAYRGYKFVGVVLTIVLGLAVPRLYVPALLYSATAMGIFLMRSHRRIILPRDMDRHESQDLARRNGFLLFVCVLQFPIYWILASVLEVKK